VTVEDFLDGRSKERRKVPQNPFRNGQKTLRLPLGMHHKLYVERHEHRWGATRSGG
jgi:hypothetical protein